MFKWTTLQNSDYSDEIPLENHFPGRACIQDTSQVSRINTCRLPLPYICDNVTDCLEGKLFEQCWKHLNRPEATKDFPNRN